MDVYEAIRAAVLPIVPVCEPDIYRGEAEEYTTFSMTELPAAHGDDEPRAVRYLVQLHYFLRRTDRPRSPHKTKRALCRAVLDAGFTYPEVTNAGEADWQHYVLEFEGVEGFAGV